MSEIGRYEESAVIGNGAYGTVYKARDKVTGEFVALKKIKVPQGEEGIPMSTLREISLLKSLSSFDHPHIIKLLDVCNGQRLETERVFLMYLVFEYVDQDLAVYMEKCPPPGLPPMKIKTIMYQMLDGIDFLHTNRLFHRDLKPQNILVTQSGHVKIADFGLTRIFDMQSVLTQVVVTLWYRAPEVLLSSKYTSAVDIWACGCVFAEMIRNRPLFAGQTETDQLCRIFEIIGTPPVEEWPNDVSIPWQSFPKHVGSKLRKLLEAELEPAGLELIEEMLVFDPDSRILAREALDHPYFSDVQKSPSQVDR